jgi:hypothetical protein
VATRLDTVIPCFLAISWNPSQNASSRLTLVLWPSNLTSLLMDADLIEGLVGRSVLIFDQPCRSRRIRVLDLDPIGRERTRKVSHKASISSLHYPDGDIRAAVPGCDCSPALTASVRVVRWRASTTHRPPPTNAPVGPARWTAGRSRGRPHEGGDNRRSAWANSSETRAQSRNGAMTTLGDMRAKKARSLLVFCKSCDATRILNVDSSRTQLHWRGLSSTTSANTAAALRQCALKMLCIIRRYWCSPNAPFVRLKMLTAEGP